MTSVHDHRLSASINNDMDLSTTTNTTEQQGLNDATVWRLGKDGYGYRCYDAKPAIGNRVESAGDAATAPSQTRHIDVGKSSGKAELSV